MLNDPRHVLVNGVLYRADAPVIRADDRGFLYGDGAFETVWVRGGQPTAWHRHLARLRRTLAALSIPDAVTDALRHQADRLLAANGLLSGEAVLRIAVSRGPGGGPRPPALQSPTVVIRAAPVTAAFEARRQGIEGVAWRGGPRAAAAHKTLAYLPSVLAAQACAPAEPLFVDATGHVSEGATCNLFMVCDGTLVTPPADGGLLPGVARGVILAAAKACGIPLDVRAVSIGELAGAEAFVTNALLPLAPLVTLDGHALAPPSGLQQTLLAQYDRFADA